MKCSNHPKQTIAGSRNRLNDHSPLASFQYSVLPQSHRADAYLAALLFFRLAGESMERSEAVGQIKRLAASGGWRHPFRGHWAGEHPRRSLHHSAKASVVLGHVFVSSIHSGCRVHPETGAYLDPGIRLVPTEAADDRHRSRLRLKGTSP